MDDRAGYILLSVFLALSGVGFIALAFTRYRWIERTQAAGFERVAMKAMDVNLIPNNLTDSGGGPLTDLTAMVLVHYTYQREGRIFWSRRVFPLDVEWIRPRVPPLKLFEDLKAGRLAHCYVEASNPVNAVIFPGWSPYLRRHVVGVAASGVTVLFLGLFFTGLMT